MDPIDNHLAEAEALLQEWLAKKPPPFYVERDLLRPGYPQADAYWQSLLEELNPETASVLADVHVVRFSHRTSVGQLDARVFRREAERLEAAAAALEALLNEPPAAMTPDQHLRGLECLSYLVAEWIEYLSVATASVQLNPLHDRFVLARQTCAAAFRQALGRGDHFRAHRAAYNLGRLIHDLEADVESAYKPLFQSLLLLEHSIDRGGEPADARWRERRLDLLHRLVELCARVPEFAMQLGDFGLRLKFPSVTPVRDDELSFPVPLGPDERDVVNLPTPLALRYPDWLPKLGAGAAVLDYVNGRRFTALTLIHGTRTWVKLFDPDKVHVGGWDRFFRPTNVEFESVIAGMENPVEADSIIVGAAGLAAARAEGRHRWLTWRVSHDVLEVTPHAPERWDTRLERRTEVYYRPEDWEERLYEILVAPLEPQLQALGVRHLVVSPDGGLAMVPFHLLCAPDGSRLLDRYSVSYLPSVSFLGVVAGFSAAGAPPRSLLIVEDPKGDLDWAHWEVEMVRACFAGRDVVVLSGSRATRENVRAAARDADVVHFCTHGRFDSVQPERSGLCIADGEWLTLGEIERLDLRANALVFLSACETARLKPGEQAGAPGIGLAFLRAGAATVVATFWEVDDLSTALVARRFYEEHIASGAGRLESLNRAVRWVRYLRSDEIATALGAGAPRFDEERPFADSFFWGAFALYGAWQ